MKIKFIARDEIVAKTFKNPSPAAKNIPNWYREQEKYVGGEKKLMSRGPGAKFNQTIKSCPAVHDGMTAGYLFYTPCDIHISQEEGMINFDFSSEAYCRINAHGQEQIGKVELDRGYYHDECVFKFVADWAVKTPKGYSSMIMHPMWREDLPFRVLPGIIDTDSYNGIMNFLFLLKRGYEGIIPAGTPVGQIIPFKRDDWKSSIEVSTLEDWDSNFLRDSINFQGTYRKNHFKKKNYK